MKIALYTAGAFVAGVFAGRWLLEQKVATEAADEITEAKSFYKDKYEKQYEATVRSFVHKWEGEDAAEKLEFKGGQPLLGDLLMDKEGLRKQADLLRTAVQQVEDTYKEQAENLIQQNVGAIDVKAAAAEAVGSSIALTESIIEKAGYTSYNNLKPVPPAGETTTTEGIRGAYVISQEEFFDRGLDKQNQITYYAGSDTLVSAKGTIVPKDDRAVLIGLDTLSKFGEMSEDDNVVYVRNPTLGAGVDFEITLDEGDYEA